MTTMNPTASSQIPHAAGAANKTGGPLAHLRSAWLEYKAYSRAVAELSALTDRELADIGIARQDVRRVAAETVYNR